MMPLTPGDVLPALPCATDAFVVGGFEPPRTLVPTVPSAAEAIVTSWMFMLYPRDPWHTRLVVRARVSRDWRALAAAAPGSSRPAGLKPQDAEHRQSRV